MRNKILIALYGQEVAPRFDLTTEALIVSVDENGDNREDKQIVLPQISAEKLCHLILTEGVRTVICGGIEEEYYQYLTWKRIRVCDSVIGRAKTALKRYLANRLQPGDILTENTGAPDHA